MEKFRSSQLPTAYTVYHDNCNTATKKKPTQTQCYNTKRPHMITEMTKIDNIIAWSMNTIFILNQGGRLSG